MLNLKINSAVLLVLLVCSCDAKSNEQIKNNESIESVKVVNTEENKVIADESNADMSDQEQNNLYTEKENELLRKVISFIERRENFQLTSSVKEVIIKSFFSRDGGFVPYEDERMISFDSEGFITQDYYRAIQNDGSYLTDGLKYNYENELLVQEDYYNYDSELEESVQYVYTVDNDVVKITNTNRPGRTNNFIQYFNNQDQIKVEIVSSDNKKIRKTLFYSNDGQLLKTIDKNNQIEEFVEGQLTTFTDFEGLLFSYKYNESGFLEQIIEKKSDGTEELVNSYEYVIDSNGNWTSQICSGFDENGTWLPISKVERDVLYF